MEKASKIVEFFYFIELLGGRGVQISSLDGTFFGRRKFKICRIGCFISKMLCKE